MTPVVITAESGGLSICLSIILVRYLYAIALACTTIEVKVSEKLAALPSLLPEVTVMDLDLLLSLILIGASKTAYANFLLLLTPSSILLHLY